MIAKQRSLIHIYKSINILNRILLFSLLLSGAFFLYSYFIPFEAKPLRVTSKDEECTQVSSQYDYNQIGKGPMALRSEIQTFPFPDLSGDVLFLSRSTRPDVSLYEAKLQMGLRGNEMTLDIASGQTIYLTYDEKHLTFSKEVTPLWIKPKVDEKGDAWLEMGIELISQSGEKLLDEVREFKVDAKWKAKNVETITDSDFVDGIKVLQHAKWWAPDQMYDQYGGEKYQKYKGLERLEVEGNGILFAKEEETFIWKDKKWKRSAETRGYPMAKVTEISPYKMEWQLWDTSGLEFVLLSFNRERSSGISIRIEDVFSHIRQRTSSRVSCRLDNRATILKEDDWIFHTSKGWHLVKDIIEVEAILNFKAKGELFIFDGLEKVDGKQVFCGTLFDPMRMQLQHVKLPLAKMKSSEHSPPTKKNFSTKIRSTSLKKALVGNQKRSSRGKIGPIQDNKIFED